jgi:hypothetical protein
LALGISSRPDPPTSPSPSPVCCQSYRSACSGRRNNHLSAAEYIERAVVWTQTQRVHDRVDRAAWPNHHVGANLCGRRFDISLFSSLNLTSLITSCTKPVMPVSHVGLTVAHVPSACSFFLSALQPLGYRYVGNQGDSVGFGTDDADFFLSPEVLGYELS